MLTKESVSLLVHIAPLDDANDPVLEILVTLMMKSLGLLVCKVIIDAYKNPAIEVLA